MTKLNKRKTSPSAAAREFAAAKKELNAAGQTISKAQRRMSPSAAAREITAAKKDLQAAIQAIFRASRHMDKPFRTRAAQIRIAKPKDKAVGPPRLFPGHPKPPSMRGFMKR
jgi:hypothetical protein